MSRSRIARGAGTLLLLVAIVPALAGCGSPDANPAGAAPPEAAAAPATPSAPSTLPSATPTDDLAALSDEFDDAGTLSRWQELAAVEGWPSQVETLDINTRTPGQLTLVPFTSTWFEDYHGAFLYKLVTGDFDVVTHIHATGQQTDLPQRTFSLAGVMARAPRTVSPATWQPGHENWVFITTGYGDEAPRRAGKPQIETKTTVNSQSTLILTPIRPGWVDLRVVRLGTLFLMLYRVEGGTWTISQRYQRADLPATLQVGLNAYTNWESIEGDAGSFNRTLVTQPHFPPDLQVHSDYVRFRRPAPAATDHAGSAGATLPNEEWIRLIGN